MKAKVPTRRLLPLSAVDDGPRWFRTARPWPGILSATSYCCPAPKAPGARPCSMTPGPGPGTTRTRLQPAACMLAELPFSWCGCAPRARRRSHQGEDWFGGGLGQLSGDDGQSQREGQAGPRRRTLRRERTRTCPQPGRAGGRRVAVPSGRADDAAHRGRGRVERATDRDGQAEDDGVEREVAQRERRGPGLVRCPGAGLGDGDAGAVRDRAL